MSVQQIAKAFRKDLLAREASAVREIEDAWTIAYDGIMQELLGLLDKMADDDPRSRISWLIREERLGRLLGQASREIQRAAGISSAVVEAGQREAVAMAGAVAQEYFDHELPGIIRSGISTSYSRAPVEAVEQFVGVMRDGSPVREVFDRYPKFAADQIERQIIEGLAIGRNPREVARRTRKALDQETPLPEGAPEDVAGTVDKLKKRAETTAREEQNRAARGSAQENYKGMRGCIGMRILSALDSRTCVVCWLRHGLVIGLDEEFGSHMVCRCTVAPVFESSDPVPLGPDLFAELDRSRKLQILRSERKLELYEQGKPLQEFVVEFTDEKWGLQHREKRLRERWS